MTKLHLEGDTRLMGALAIITRQNFAEILLQSDEAKTEASSLLPLHWWSSQEDGALGFPGGGRAENAYGLPETLYQTLLRELIEELRASPRARLPVKTSLGVAQQSYPTLAAQIPRDSEERIINQIGVTTVLFPYDTFPRQSRSDIDQAVDEERAIWVSLEALARIGSRHDAVQNTEFGYHLRPQVLTAALLWYASIWQHESDAHQRDRIIAGNAQAHRWIATQAGQMGRTVVNGSILPDGTMAPTLSRRDRHFLRGRPRRSQE